MQTVVGFEEISGVIRFARTEDARAWRVHQLGLEDAEDLGGVFPDAMLLTAGTVAEVLAALAADPGGVAEEEAAVFVHAFPTRDDHGQRSLPIAACALAAARFSASGSLYFLGDASFCVRLDGRGGYRLADTSSTTAPSLPAYREAAARVPRPASAASPAPPPAPPAALARPSAAEERFVLLRGRPRWPLDRRLYPPGAKVLREARLAGRVVPAEVLPALGSGWSAFEAPGGGVLVFEGLENNQHRVRLWRDGAWLVVAAPPMYSPCPHAFVEGRLFLGTSRELVAVDLATGQSSGVCALDCSSFQPGLAAAGRCLCVASAEKLQILEVPSLAERWSAPCRLGGYAGAIDHGALVAFGAREGSQIVRVGDACETFALAPFCIEAAWDEDGRIYLNGHEPGGDGYKYPGTYELRR
jgi:hypothetical protein